jgi:hypothetical protein
MNCRNLGWLLFVSINGCWMTELPANRTVFIHQEISTERPAELTPFQVDVSRLPTGSVQMHQDGTSTSIELKDGVRARLLIIPSTEP